jgi:hypothetical protein
MTFDMNRQVDPEMKSAFPSSFKRFAETGSGRSSAQALPRCCHDCGQIRTESWGRQRRLEAAEEGEPQRLIARSLTSSPTLESPPNRVRISAGASQPRDDGRQTLAQFIDAAPHDLRSELWLLVRAVVAFQPVESRPQVFTSRGTHQGEFQGIAPTDRRVEFTGIVIYRIAGQKIAESWGELDFLRLMRRLRSAG